MNEEPFLRELGKMVAGSFYDHQQVRIQEFSRIRDIVFRKMEGLGLTEVQDKKEEDSFEKKYDDKKIPEYIEQLVKEGKLTKDEKDYIYRVFEVQKNAQKYEREYEKLMMEFVKTEPVYNEFLSKIKGLSAILSANLIKELGYCDETYTEDFYNENGKIKHAKGDLKCPYISSVWKYFGMHVNDGESPKRKKGEKLNFNLKRRTLAWKIADSFIKQRSPVYRQIYDDEKEKQLNRMKTSKCKYCGKPTGKISGNTTKITHPIKPKSNGQRYCSKNWEQKVSLKDFEFDGKSGTPPWSIQHANNRASRKMVKIFLAHYWMWCKEHKGENAPKPYAEEELGHKHIFDWREVLKANNALKEK